MCRCRPQRQPPSVRVQGATPQQGTCEEKQQCLNNVPRNDYVQLPVLKHFFRHFVIREFLSHRFIQIMERDPSNATSKRS
jgi:hypothetical protein